MLCPSREDKITIFKNPTEIPTPTLECLKRKHQALKTDVVGLWYTNNMRNYKPPTYNKMLSNNIQED